MQWLQSFSSYLTCGPEFYKMLGHKAWSYNYYSSAYSFHSCAVVHDQRYSKTLDILYIHCIFNAFVYGTYHNEVQESVLHIGRHAFFSSK